MEIEQVKAALKWALETGAYKSPYTDDPLRLLDAGCGCCSYTLEVPEEYKNIVKEVLSG